MIASHATVLFVSYSAFLLSVLAGALFLMEERKLKLKDPAILSIPNFPLETLDRIHLVSIAVGFGFFSLGMVQGHLLAKQQWGAYFSRDPKEIWTMLTWAAYAAVLALRLTVGLRGRRGVWMSVASFGLVLFTYVGVNHLIGTRHLF